MTRTVLIVEDDAELRSGLKDNLEFEGYQVAEAWNFKDAEEKWIPINPSLVILDLMLPGRSGYQLLNKMRNSGYETPVIILSARGEIWDKVKGFRLGCDDYMVKPFSIIELLIRIEALLRRANPEQIISNTLSFEDVELDLTNMEIKVGNLKKSISGKEFELLRFFLSHPNRVIHRSEILDKVWNSKPDLVTRTVDVCVANLRRRLEGSLCKIETVYKAGYRLRPIKD